MTKALQVEGFKKHTKLLLIYPMSYHSSKSLRIRNGRKKRVTTKNYGK